MRFSLKDVVLKILDWIHFPFIHNSIANTNTYYRARRDDTSTEVAFGVGSGGVNHGVWSDKQAKWLLYGDNSNVYVGGMKVANTVIEENTSGIWTYRKWADGNCEAWGLVPSKSYAITSQSGNGYWVAQTTPIPSGIFTSVSHAQANRGGGNGLVFISVYSLSSTSISYYVSCTLNVTITMSIYLYVKGRWK